MELSVIREDLLASTRYMDISSKLVQSKYNPVLYTHGFIPEKAINCVFRFIHPGKIN